MRTRFAVSCMLIVLFAALLTIAPGARAASEAQPESALFPLTDYDKAVLDGLDVQADLRNGVVAVAYDGSVTEVTLKQPKERIVFYIGTDYSLSAPSSIPTNTLVIKNETGSVYKLADYYYAFEFRGFPRVYNGAAAKSIGDANPGDTQKRAFLSNLTPDSWWAINKAHYFGSDASCRDLSVLSEAVNDVALCNDPCITETSSAMLELAAYYYSNVIRLTFDQAGCPVSKNMAATEKADLTLYNYLYRSEENRARTLRSFFPNKIGKADFCTTMAYSFDGARIGNGYQGVTLLNAFIFVLEREPDAADTAPMPPQAASVTPSRPPKTGDALNHTGIFLLSAALLPLALRRRLQKFHSLRLPYSKEYLDPYQRTVNGASVQNRVLNMKNLNDAKKISNKK